MSVLFNRQAELIIVNKRDSRVSTLIKNLRISFTIEKNSGTNPNKAEINVYNLSQKTRSLLTGNVKKKDYPIVILNVGYGNELVNIFTGTLDASYTKVSYRRSGSELVYRAECLDGSSELGAVFEKSYAPNSKIYQIIDDIMKETGIIKKIMPDKVKQLLEKPLYNGYSIAGTTKKTLTTLTESVNVEWSIQDRTLIFVEKGEGNSTGFSLSSSTGLLGVPSINEEKKLSLTTLLLPKLKPTDIFELQSENIKGFFRIERIVHKGDTHASEWVSEIEATAQ